MPNPPPVQTAVVGNNSGGLEISTTAPIPTIQDDLVLIHTKAISVNPVDAKMAGPYITPGAISGCDFAGVVESVGPSATDRIRPGDRVCAAIMGQDPLSPTSGAFAEHVIASAAGLIKLPDMVTFEAGAALGTSFMTAGLALFHSLALPGYPLAPAEKPGTHVLVYGGSTATGTAAIQLLRIAGFVPVVTASPHNADLVRSFGAEVVFDYHSASCGQEIRGYMKNGLRYTLDCIGTVASMKICYEALGRAGGRYTALDPFPESVAASRKMVKADWVLGPLMLGKDIGWPAPHGRPADPEIYAFGLRWTKTVQELVDRGLIREHPIRVQSGGLEGVLEGMEALRGNKISGTKLVYRLNDA